MLNKFTFLYNEAGAAAGGGGGTALGSGIAPATPQGGTPAAGATPEPGQASGTPEALPIVTEEGTFSPQWYKGNSELEQYGKTLDKFQSPEALAKSYANLEKHRTVPGDQSEASAVEAFRQANGIPATHNDYEINLPEDLPAGLQVDEASMGEYKELFHKINVTPAQAQQISDAHIEITSRMLDGMIHEQEQASQQQMDQLQSEWGTAFQGKLETADNAYKALCAKVGVDAESFGLKDDANFVKLMSAVASMTGESQVVGTGAAASAGSLTSGKQEAHDIMTNTNNPDYSAFYDHNDPRHQEVQDKVARLNH